jgi:hypothetical protein
MLTPPCALPLGIMAVVVTPNLHALEFLLRKKRHDTGLPPRTLVENSLGGKVLGRTHSPSLGRKLAWGQGVRVDKCGCVAAGI